ncbi:hypothetical protein ACPDHL_07375 [Myroides sp. C15-4]|uniref:hypothetical protein n=1 Tax=Myroides sp. C15-4 TaxID=3400532 RepID=UPI003D2F7406
MNQEEKFERHLNNFFNTIYEICKSNNYDYIKSYSIPHGLTDIEKFEKANADSDLRRKYLEYLKSIFNEAFSLIESKSEWEENKQMLKDLETRVYKMFSDVKLEKELVLSAEEKVLLLDYLGVLQYLNTEGYSQKTQYQLLAKILDRSEVNIKKAISNVGGLVKEKEGVKNRNSLNKLKTIVENTKGKTPLDKILADLDRLDKK